MARGRCTISKPVTVTGIGLHSGVNTDVRLKPAPSDNGIVFRRIDLQGTPSVKASVDAVFESDRRTTIGAGVATVGTVEHLLAAVYASGVDDLILDVGGPELPVGDGSAREFVEAIDRAGIVEHEGEKEVIRVADSYTVVEGDAKYALTPSDRFSVSVTVEWDHPLIGRQVGSYDITREAFAESLAGARTFGFMEEVNELRAKGLAKGASESTVIVLTRTGVVGPNLRWPDEFVRHKAVDLVGDLALLGARIEADIAAFRPNHRGNVALAHLMERIADTDELL